MEAFAAFFRNLSKKNQVKYHPLLPEILNILPPIKDSNDSEDLSKALVALIDLAETAPKMFKPLFRNLVVFSVSVIQDKELDSLSRQNALELMATFADYAPSMCKKDSSYTNDMITQCLSLMTDLAEDDDDAAEWLASDDVSVHRPFLLPNTETAEAQRLMANSWRCSSSRKKATRTTWQANSAWIAWPTSSEAWSFWGRPSAGFPA